MSVIPVTSGSDTLASGSNPSGLQPQVAGSPRVVSHLFPGLVLPTFEEATESTCQQTSSASILSSVQNTFVGSQPSSVSILSSASELLTVSEHTEEEETIHVPVETLSVNAP